MILLVLAAAVVIFAQDTRPAAAQGGGQEFTLPPGVTWDEVNQVAGQMYCDVCEGIPLDECESAACRQWREEIARQLSEGRTENEIIDYFVERYGDEVASIPRRTGDRAIAYLFPAAIVAVLGLLGFAQVRRLRQQGLQPGQVAHRTNERLKARPLPDNLDPALFERLQRDLEKLD
ncbi:MAG: cytochrome c-type biogenesis protein CcmH [Chloroflexi bacterium]|nr:cytochrome c-type biogenesis protein CcmH [Chloroflexota bacterium]